MNEIGSSSHPVQAAECVLPCAELEETLQFFIERLGFRLHAIFPADRPSVAVIAGHGLRIRLQRDGPGAPGVLRLLCRDTAAFADGAKEMTAPNGTRIELVDADPPLVVPPCRPSWVVSTLDDTARWGPGRAGMLYRDLVPDRQGGRFIGSHIRIPDGGPVPDYVHFHKVRFQMIYCYKGWVRIAYEDQGPPLIMNGGDCVLQPPEIRHRVLESSPGLEVIEIGCPANHETFADHRMSLPTPVARRERIFGGQRFVHHQAAAARWRPWRLAGFECRDTGIAAATDGLAGVQVARRSGAAQPQVCHHDAEFLFVFVLDGTATLRSRQHGTRRLAAGDSFVVPATLPHAVVECSDDVQLLQVALPAAFETVMEPDLSIGA
ncbi:MAG: cupin domain-containing protein [Acidobacteriota bacterium]